MKAHIEKVFGVEYTGFRTNNTRERGFCNIDLKKLCIDIQSDGKCVFEDNTSIQSLTDSEIQSINSSKSLYSTPSAFKTSKASNSYTVIEQHTENTEQQDHEIRLMIAKERETHLLDKHKDKSGVYFLKHLFDPIVKFGSSNNITKRIKQHKRSFGKEKIYLDKVIETDKYIDVERVVRVHSNEKYTDEVSKKHTEIIKYSSEEELQKAYLNIDASVKRMIRPPEYSIELEIEREKSKQEEEKSKQEEEKRKQLELKIELLKLSKSIEKTI